LTGNITSDADGIVVERENIVIDGAGYMVEGTVNGNGIDLVSKSKVTIKNTQIKAFWNGIRLGNSSTNIIYGNNITTSNTAVGVYHSSNNNTISRNSLTSSNYYGIGLLDSSDNRISGNNITDNSVGISLLVLIDINKPTNNHILHNNFVNNTQSAHVPEGSSTNIWDDGYPSGGNYWSDYHGNDADHDGIGDDPYVIDANDVDHYPLMGHFESFNVSTWNHPDDGFEEVDVISNFTISDLGLFEWLTTPNQYLQAGQLFLRLVPVQGQNITTGFSRITLPNNILNTSYYIVLIDMTPVNVNKLAISNDTHTTLYFTFNTSAKEGIITVPELPIFLILLPSMTATLFAVIIYRRMKENGII
jgi:parallel beta-helix repeat protein